MMMMIVHLGQALSALALLTLGLDNSLEGGLAFAYLVGPVASAL